MAAPHMWYECVSGEKTTAPSLSRRPIDVETPGGEGGSGGAGGAGGAGGGGSAGAVATVTVSASAPLVTDTVVQAVAAVTAAESVDAELTRSDHVVETPSESVIVLGQ